MPLSVSSVNDDERRRALSEEGHLVSDTRPELHSHRGKPLLVEQLRDERVQAGGFTPHDHICESKAIPFNLSHLFLCICSGADYVKYVAKCFKCLFCCLNRFGSVWFQSNLMYSFTTC